AGDHRSPPASVYHQAAGPIKCIYPQCRPGVLNASHRESHQQQTPESDQTAAEHVTNAVRLVTCPNHHLPGDGQKNEQAGKQHAAAGGTEYVETQISAGQLEANEEKHRQTRERCRVSNWQFIPKGDVTDDCEIEKAYEQERNG